MCSIRYFHVEVQPVFKQEDGSYKYPDTYNGGSWKITKPQAEIDVVYAKWYVHGKIYGGWAIVIANILLFVVLFQILN
nr:hypothetical protein [Acinetobacter sp. AC1-2]